MSEFDFDELLNDVETEVEAPETADFDSLLDEPENLDDLLDNDVVMDPVTEPVPEVAVETPAPVQEAPDFTNTGVEFASETTAYAKAFLDLEMQKKALQQEQRELKEEYKDYGVDTVATARAMRALAKELKETPAEVQAEESIKEMFRKDDQVYSTIAGLNS